MSQANRDRVARQIALSRKTKPTGKAETALLHLTLEEARAIRDQLEAASEPSSRTPLDQKVIDKVRAVEDSLRGRTDTAEAWG